MISWLKTIFKKEEETPLMLQARSKSVDIIFLKNLFRKEIFDIDFRAAIEHFNNANYSQAYKMLFKLWKRSETCNRKFFYQALLKTCASLELINQGKLEGSKVIYRAAINQLLTFSSLERPINISLLVDTMIKYFDFIDHDLDPVNTDVQIVSRPKLKLVSNIEQVHHLNYARYTR